MKIAFFYIHKSILLVILKFFFSFISLKVWLWPSNCTIYFQCKNHCLKLSFCKQAILLINETDKNIFKHLTFVATNIQTARRIRSPSCPCEILHSDCGSQLQKRYIWSNSVFIKSQTPSVLCTLLKEMSTHQRKYHFNQTSSKHHTPLYIKFYTIYAGRFLTKSSAV